MNKIEELIKQHCPNGVKFEPLEKIANVDTGEQLNKNLLYDSGLYPVMNGGIYPSGRYNRYNTEKDNIAISQGGASAGYVNWMKECFWAGAHCYTVQLTTDKVLKKYVYYILKNNQEDFMKSQQGAGIPSLNRKKLNKLSIPVPPMPVQEEIVRVLDAFTALEAELEAELEARKRQYEYYRNKLLTFDENTTGGRRIKFVQLGDACDIYTGGEVPEDCVKGSFPDSTHLYPVYGNGKDIYGYSSTYRIDKDAVCISSIGANTGAVFFYKKNFTPIIRLKVLVPRNNNINTRYLYHIATTLTFVSKNNGGIPNMNANDVRRHIIPIPPLEEQERIVAILDKFDSLVNDISEGLPAELNARRQQYEYYRNKLLTFEEAA